MQDASLPVAKVRWQEVAASGLVFHECELLYRDSSPENENYTDLHILGVYGHSSFRHTQSELYIQGVVKYDFTFLTVVSV